MLPPSKRYNCGFTLVEVIITVVLIGIVSGITAGIVSMGFKVLGDIQIRKDIVMDGSTSVNKFTREYGHLSDSGSLQIADGKKIRFSNTLGVTLEYELTNGKFYRTIIGQPQGQILANSVDVTSSSFKYFEKNNSELTSVPLIPTDRAKVWMVELVLILINGNESIRYLSDVFPENLKL